MVKKPRLCVAQGSISAMPGARDKRESVLSGLCGNSGDLPPRLQANTPKRHTQAGNLTAKSVFPVKREDAP